MQLRPVLTFLGFFVAVVGLTFVGTFVHEVSHAAAWGEVGAVRFFEDRDAAEAALAKEESRVIDGRTYRVQVIETTTVVLYPKAILANAATLGLAPAAVLPSNVMGSTFYALDEQGYHDLAHGHSATEWHHSAMPMIVNALLGIPILIWLIKRPGWISMAFAWVNASEWRFNVHHAQEIGIPAGIYLGFSVLLMAAVGAYIGLVGGRRKEAPSPAVDVAAGVEAA